MQSVYFKTNCHQKANHMRASHIQLAAVAVPYFIIYFFSSLSIWIQLLYCCGIDSFIEICTLKPGIYHNSAFKWHWKTATLKGKDDEEINLRQVFFDKGREQRLLAFICQKINTWRKMSIPHCCGKNHFSIKSEWSSE